MELASKDAAVLLLQSVLHCEGKRHRATLRDIIAFADFIDHSIFTFNEFSGAAGILIATGVVTQKDGDFRTSRSFRDWRRKNIPVSDRPNYGHERRLIREYMDTILSGKYSNKLTMSPESFRAAVDSYLANSQ